MEGGNKDKDTRFSNSSSFLADEDYKKVEIPESEFMLGYNDNAHNTTQGFVSIMRAKHSWV